MFTASHVINVIARLRENFSGGGLRRGFLPADDAAWGD
ncbi:uncharacterized protein EbC_43170 [Erwinia billingiae Eb661]|uniref:Uncharacterized protein n=1 Tax=Erwinia billingiae (strain Eb661) TaxID=634500 RepID=D8ML20_ERWBE|nr:uncharacterized protein EbC_43170 [Erwinia billingiae Eb661]